MENVRPIRWAWLPLVFACAFVGLTMVQRADAQTNSSSGWWPFNHPTSPAPAPPPTDDPIDLKTPAKVGVELYVAVANMYVQSGKYAEAEDQYQQAMKMAPDDVRVLLGYAILKDQMNQSQEALKYYRKAVEKHPKQASVYNNLAVHYAKHDMIRQAIEAAQRAVDLRPSEPRYRNNLAALFVEAGMPQEAYKQLREVYDEPVSHYNLGFLLNKRGMKAAAMQEFTIALRFSPRMTLARQWVERLSRERADENSTARSALPPPNQPQAAYAANPSDPRGQVLPAPPNVTVPPQYSYQVPQPAFAPNPDPRGQALPAPPSATIPPQYTYQVPVTAQAPYPAQSPPPVQIQYPAQVPYPAPQQNLPQIAGPQIAGPQYQNPAPPASPGVNRLPVIIARHAEATDVRVISPPAADENGLRRLPPVNDAQHAADPNSDVQGPEIVAPDPPNWRR